VLQREQAEVGELGDFLAWGPDTKDTTLFARSPVVVPGTVVPGAVVEVISGRFVAHLRLPVDGTEDFAVYWLPWGAALN
jgi:hypothetical protein